MTLSKVMESAWLGVFLQLLVAFLVGFCLGLMALNSPPDHIALPANFDPCWGGFVTLLCFIVGKQVARS